MIQASKLGHVALKVRDIVKSREFYVRTLGLKVAREYLEPRVVFLSFGQAHIELTLFEEQTKDAPLVSHMGLHHTARQLESFQELQAAHRQLKTMGVTIECTIEHGVTRSIYFHDPDRNRLELYCNMVKDGFEFMRTVGPSFTPLDLEQEAR
jgi:catechol 2,3-dioxygenase